MEEDGIFFSLIILLIRTKSYSTRRYTRQRHDDAGQRLQEWLSKIMTEGKKLCILEFGVGFNTPSVLRWPMESLAYNNDNVTIVRVNLEDANLAEEIPIERRVSVEEDVLSVVKLLHGLVQETQS